MVKAPAVLLLSMALAGCAMAPQARLAPDPAFKPAVYAWDGAGEDPNQQPSASEPSRAMRAASKAERNTSQAALQPYSKEWWQAQDGIDAEQDARVSRALVICQGCLRPQPQPEDTRLAKAAD
ncbi:hypothetical protein [Bradyrhizobium sp.]|uniref:hypothetical protein n=1 Tax=Bradyrhizobium sp. TaxID=376 RepID=UPI0039E2852B